MTDIEKCINALNNDGVVIIPTDTIYGFSGNISSIKSAERIRDIKDRENKPFLILDSDIDRVKDYFHKSVHSFIDKLINEKLWPNNITLIGQKNPNYPMEFLGSIETVGVRYTDNKTIKELTDGTGEGLLSTSINRSGEKELTDIEEIKEGYTEIVDFILDKGNVENSTSSTIILISGDKINILREGREDIVNRINSLL